MNHRVYSNIMKKVIGENKKSAAIYICCIHTGNIITFIFNALMVLRYKSEVIRSNQQEGPWFYVTQQYSRIYIIFISGFYGGRGGGSPKWKHDKYEEVVQMEEPSSTTDN